MFKLFKKFYFTLIFLLISISAAYSQNVDSSFVIGEFIITKVVDGDTFKFDKLDKSTRLLGIDTEETFKDKNAQQKSFDLIQSWPQEYYNEQRKNETTYPIKIDSPFGFETWMWAKDFVKDATSVRLEIENPDRIIDSYGRYLVYMFLNIDGKYINYNLECVRRGYSPYFTKYGYSKRFHKEFLEAQEYARKNKLGIWNPDSKCYPDYDQRLIWWNKRAEQIKEFETEFLGVKNAFNLMNNSDVERLKNFIGMEVIILGNVAEIYTNKDPAIIKINIAKGIDFDLVFKQENRDILNDYNLVDMKEYFVCAKGTLSQYHNNFQIIIEKKSQFWMY
ncbi:MAG: thermonuclease family protein [Ignavibacteria bacterium]|nr:thermonuclease family protein [Ignavibacteria bacterium]